MRMDQWRYARYRRLARTDNAPKQWTHHMSLDDEEHSVHALNESLTRTFACAIDHKKDYHSLRYNRQQVAWNVDR